MQGNCDKVALSEGTIKGAAGLPLYSISFKCTVKRLSIVPG
jgi:hypothetical protein